MSIHRTDFPKEPVAMSSAYHLAGSSRSCDICGKHYNPTHIYALIASRYPVARYACEHCITANKLELGKKSLARFILNRRNKKEAS